MDIKTNTAEVKSAARTIKSVRNAMPKAFYSAINRVTQMTRTESSRKVRDEYQVRSKDVNRNVIVRRAKVSDLTAELRWKDRNIPLIRFRTNPSKVPERAPRVLKAAVKRNGLKQLPGAFITRLGSGGHVGVFKRAGRRRLPIQELYGPAVPVMLNRPGIVEHIQKYAVDAMEKRLDHEVNRQLEKVGEKLT